MSLSTIMIYAVNDFLLDLANFRTRIENQRSQIAGTVEYRVIENTLDILVKQRASIVDVKGRPGIGAYIKRVFGNDAADIGARLNALQSAIETAGLTIRNAAPVDGNGYVLAYQFVTDPTDVNQWVYRTVTPGQSSGLRANLDAVLTAVDALFTDLSG